MFHLVRALFLWYHLYFVVCTRVQFVSWTLIFGCVWVGSVRPALQLLQNSYPIPAYQNFQPSSSDCPCCSLTALDSLGCRWLVSRRSGSLGASSRVFSAFLSTTHWHRPGPILRHWLQFYLPSSVFIECLGATVNDELMMQMAIQARPPKCTSHPKNATTTTRRSSEAFISSSRCQSCRCSRASSHQHCKIRLPVPSETSREIYLVYSLHYMEVHRTFMLWEMVMATRWQRNSSIDYMIIFFQYYSNSSRTYRMTLSSSM
jgi:hypothetical protein